MKRGLGGTSIGEGTKNIGNGRKEPAVKVDHAKESLEGW